MDHLLKQLPHLRKMYVTIGFHEDAGSYDDGTSVVEVALWNEFGTKTSPVRSFIRSTLEEKVDDINNWREEALKKIIEEGWTAEKALSMIGLRVSILIQNKIKSNVPPPNAPSTVDHKKSEGTANRTLIETGLMLRSVTYRVMTK